jgi:hypothetical protein
MESRNRELELIGQLSSQFSPVFVVQEQVENLPERDHRSQPLRSSGFEPDINQLRWGTLTVYAYLYPASHDIDESLPLETLRKLSQSVPLVKQGLGAVLVLLLLNLTCGVVPAARKCYSAAIKSLIGN